MEPTADEMYEDVQNNKATSESGAFSTEIVNAIVALKAAASDWPTDVKTPAFRDEAASVYLNIVPKKMARTSYSIISDLPHPLSMDRSVCYIGNDVETEEQQAEKTQTLRDQGVLGQIKIIPDSILETAIKSEDRAALEELAEGYDTHFACNTSFGYLWHNVMPEFLAKNKILDLVPHSAGMKFDKTVLFKNSSEDGYFVKVGHSGLTDEQLQENVAYMVDYIKLQKLPALVSGLPGVKLMQLKTGTTEGVPIYKDVPISRDVPINKDVPKYNVVKNQLKQILSKRVIFNGIAMMKAAADWPKELTTPVFDSESDSVYLNVLVKDATTIEDTTQDSVMCLYHLRIQDFNLRRDSSLQFANDKSTCQKVKTCTYIFPSQIIIYTRFLPHPLSMNRSLCFFVSNNESKEKVAQWRQYFRNQGIVGKIQIVPADMVLTSFENDDHAALQELAALYDMYFADANYSFIEQKLKPLLEKENKFISCLNRFLQLSFGRSTVWVNSAKDGLCVKVGDTGLTDQQLQENISHAVNLITTRETFLNGVKDIKLIQVKTGTTEGVTIHQDDSPAKAKRSALVPAQVISDGIAALKADSADWPKEAKFNDDAATVTLNVVTSKWTTSMIQHKSICIALPHPLSLDRSVCYVTSERQAVVHDAELTQKLRDAGVLGKIKIIPRSLVEWTLRNNEKEALAELAQIYDTHLWDVNLKTVPHKDVKRALEKEYKQFFNVSATCLDLDNSVMWRNVTKTGYFVKVGHTGLTDDQLHENISSVADFIHQKSQGIFPDGLACIKSLRLTTGTSEGVTIYQDSSAEENAASQQEELSGTEKSDGAKQNGASHQVASETASPAGKRSGKRKKTDPKAASVAAPKTAPLSSKKARSEKRKMAQALAMAKKLKAN